MATLRKRARLQKRGTFTPEAIKAFEDRDWQALHRELKLRPWVWGHEAVFADVRVQELANYIGRP